VCSQEPSLFSQDRSFERRKPGLLEGKDFVCVFM
jgi:hypothetical protein